MNLKSIYAYLCNHPLVAVVLLPSISGLLVNYVYNDVIWHTHDTPKIKTPQYITPTATRPPIPIALNSQLDKNNTEQTTVVEKYKGPQPIVAVVPSTPSRSMLPKSRSQQEPPRLSRHSSMLLNRSDSKIIKNEEDREMKPSEIRGSTTPSSGLESRGAFDLRLDLACPGIGFRPFNRSVLIERVKRHLRGYPIEPIFVVAGYRKKLGEDDGTTIEVAIDINRGSFPKLDCNEVELLYLSKDSYVDDAATAIAQKIEHL